MNQSVKNLACPGCGCVCDDLTLTLQDNSITEFSPNCQLGENWFRRHSQPPAQAPFQISGEPATLSEACEQAATILSRADYPLIYGLSRSVTASQREAVALADWLGGAIDTTASLCHGPSIMALQEFGEVTATLGEVRNRADLVIFWGCNPADSHPRHFERYSIQARGRHLQRGRDDRTVVMIGDENRVDEWQLDASGTTPDLVIRVKPDEDFETIAALRILIKGGTPANDAPELQQLISLMKECQYGVVFFGLGMSNIGPRSETGHNDVGALLQLVAELNTFTRFTARRMRLQGDVSGADNVVCWQTGYPFGVDFSRGYPRYNPGEYTAGEMLERGDVDACLLVGSETLSSFSSRAIDHLKRIPSVVIDYPGTECLISPAVHITTAVYGIHEKGTVYRMDNVPLELAAPLKTDLPTDEAVLHEIHTRCRQTEDFR